MAIRRGEAVAPESPTFRVRDLPVHGWILLGWRPRAELVFGTVTKPWKARGSKPKQPVSGENFAGFSEPGFAKLAKAVIDTGGSAAASRSLARVTSTSRNPYVGFL